MKKLFSILAAIVLVAAVVMSAVPARAQEGAPPVPPPMPAGQETNTVLFSDEFESGTFLYWDDTYSSGAANFYPTFSFNCPPPQNMWGGFCALSEVKYNAAGKAYVIDRHPTAQHHNLVIQWISRPWTTADNTAVFVPMRFVSDTGVILGEVRIYLDRNTGTQKVRVACRDYANPSAMRYTPWESIFDGYGTEDLVWFQFQWIDALEGVDGGGCWLAQYDPATGQQVGGYVGVGANTEPYGAGKVLLGVVDPGSSLDWSTHWFDYYSDTWVH